MMRIPVLIGGRVGRASGASQRQARLPFRFFPPKFRNPLPHPARVAVLVHKFAGSNLRVFAPADSEAIQAFRPEILAGPLHALEGLSESVRAPKAVVVFTDSCSSPLSDATRDWVWNRFAVPCFEQLLNARGEVIAEECQVHAGLHVLRAESVFGMLSSAECDCGRTEPRLAAAMR